MSFSVIDIGTVTEVIAGQSPPSATYNQNREGLPFYQGKADFGEWHPVTRMWCNGPLKIAIPGDVLISVRAPVGPTNLASERCCIGRGLSALRPNRDRLDSRYLIHFLRFHEAILSGMGRGSTFSSITQKDLREIPIPLPHKNGNPDVHEQQRIAAILDKADAIRRKRQQALRLTDNFLRSVFIHLFGDPVTNPKGWEIRDLHYVIGNSFRNGLSPSSKGTVAGKVLTLTAITTGSFSPEYAREAFFDRAPSENQLVTANTFLICRGNGNKSMVGIGVFPEADMAHVAFPDTMIACTVDRDLIEPDYLQNLWSTAHIRTQIEAGARTTNGTYKVNQTLLGSIAFPLPPVSLQKDFSKIAKSLRSKAQKSALATESSEDLFASLQQRAFRGEL